MKRTKPPFRADHVGSILRSSPIQDAREKRKPGPLTAAALKEVAHRGDEEGPAPHLSTKNDGHARRGLEVIDRCIHVFRGGGTQYDVEHADDGVIRASRTGLVLTGSPMFGFP